MAQGNRQGSQSYTTWLPTLALLTGGPEQVTYSF